MWPGRSLSIDMIKDEWESREEGGGRRGPPHIGRPVRLASLVVKKKKHKSKLLIIVSSMVHIPWLSNFSFFFFCNSQVFIFQDFLSVPFTNSQKQKKKRKIFFPWFSSLPLDASLWLVLVAAGLTALVSLSLLIWIYSSLGLFGSVFH